MQGGAGFEEGVSGVIRRRQSLDFWDESDECGEEVRSQESESGRRMTRRAWSLEGAISGQRSAFGLMSVG